MEKIIYTNTSGESIELSERRPFILSGKDGFDSVHNNIYSQATYLSDGAELISHQLGVRTIVLRGVLVGATKEDYLRLRRSLIGIFNPKLAGTLMYVNDNGTYEIDVIPDNLPVIESEGNGFRNIKGYQITLSSLDPYWKDKSEIDAEIPMAREENLFEFPLEITDNFEFSRLIAGDVIEIQNNGDVAVGAVFTINVNGILVNPRLYNVITQEYFALNGTFTTGTKLRISTVRGKKRVEQDDGDGWYNIMTKRKVESTFLQIERGINYLQLQADSGVEFTTSYIRFEPKILGV